VAYLNPYEVGRAAARLQAPYSCNPYSDSTRDADDWQRGWIRQTGERLRRLGRFGVAVPRFRGPALIIPHPALSAEQCEVLCRREGLALAHRGHARFVLVQTSARQQTMLRIALTPDFRRDRRRFDRRPDPEAA
jgi:hypothetical protein